VNVATAPGRLFSGSRRKHDDATGVGCFAGNCQNLVRPQLERGALLRAVERSIVDTGHACLVPGNVIEHRLNDVWLNARHASGDGSAHVMQALRRDRAILGCVLGNRVVESGFCLGPALKRPTARAEN
jgi:hypothetical protein